ncbi:hypothetical protein [Methylomonas fluvii]|nr:hypothetical protein [Methylomonas fluvii]
MAWYEKLIDGTAVKDKNVVSCKARFPPLPERPDVLAFTMSWIVHCPLAESMTVKVRLPGNTRLPVLLI